MDIEFTKFLLNPTSVLHQTRYPIDSKLSHNFIMIFISYSIPTLFKTNIMTSKRKVRKVQLRIQFESSVE